MKAFDKHEKFEDAARDAIVEMFGEDLRTDGDWRVFTNEGDVFEPYKTSPRFDPKHAEEMRELVSHQIGPMQKEIERMMLARKRSHYEPGRRSGALNPSSLHRLQTGDPRVFRKKHVTRAKDTAVSLVVDCSGSMGFGPGSRLAVAFETAYGLAMTLERCRIPVTVSGFSTKHTPPDLMVEQVESEHRLGVRYSISGEVHYQPIFKSWQERMTSEVSNRFADMRYDNNDIIANNIDPLAVEWAVRDIMGRQEDRKVVIVISDGEPAFAGDMGAAQQRLKDSVAQAENVGVEVVGIGVQSRSVEHYYKHNVVINRISDLGGTVMQELRRILFK